MTNKDVNWKSFVYKMAFFLSLARSFQVSIFQTFINPWQCTTDSGMVCWKYFAGAMARRWAWVSQNKTSIAGPQNLQNMRNLVPFQIFLQVLYSDSFGIQVMGLNDSWKYSDWVFYSTDIFNRIPFFLPQTKVKTFLLSF